MSPSADIGIPVRSLLIGEDSDPETKRKLGQAIRACRLGRATQDEVAERTGIGQSTLSSYEKGLSVPAALRLWDIERACGREPGWIVVNAGLVANIKTVPDAIAMDPALDDDGRSSLLRAYRGAAKVRRLRANDAGDDGEVRL